MKKITTILCCALLVLALSAGSAVAIDVDNMKFPKLNKVQIPDIEKITLDNGMRLYILEDHKLPMFNASIRLNAGSFLDPEEQIGLAGICATVMRTGGTQKWKKGDEIDSLLESVGGYVELGMDITSGSGSVNILSEHMNLGLEVLAEVLQRPQFDEDKIDLAKVQARSGISRRNDDQMPLARREWTKLVYGENSVFARHSEYATIDAIDRAALVGFHDTWIRPQNIQMAIWGDFDTKTVVAKINELFGSWERGTTPVPPLPEVEAVAKPGVYYAEKEDAAQSFVRMGHLGGKYTDDGYQARLVMNSILNGGFGSRITDNVRTKMGLAYSSAGNVIDNFSHPGYFFSYAATKGGSTVLAAKEIIKQIKSMQTDLPTDKEMGKGKDGYLNSFVFNFDSKSEVINRLMTYDFYGIPEDFLEKEKEGVENLSAEDVMKASQEFLSPENMVILVVGDDEDFDEPLENLGLGPVTEVDITIPSGEPAQELAITPANIEKGMGLLRYAAEAGGGVDAYKGVKSMHSKANLTIYMGPQQMPAVQEEYQVFPDKSSTMLQVMGMNIPSVRNGAEGWNKNPQTGEVTAMSEEDLQKADEELQRSTTWILAHLDAPYYQAVYLGKDNVEGFDIEWVTLVKPEDQSTIVQLGIDSDGNIRCTKHWGQTMMGEGMITSVRDEFQAHGGVKMPMSSSATQNGQKFVEVKYTERNVNADVPESVFAKPE